MPNSKLDENSRPTVICVSSVDGTSVTAIQASPTGHALEVSDDITGSDNGNNGGNAMLDENSIPVWTALASDGSGTIVEVYADAVTKKVLINSN